LIQIVRESHGYGYLEPDREDALRVLDEEFTINRANMAITIHRQKKIIMKNSVRAGD